jgi:aspartate/methionine/tyrosine aminotransferase
MPRVKPLAAAASQLPVHGVREIMDAAWKRPDAIHLEVGEPNFPTPEVATAAGIAALREGFTHYTSNAGIPSLRAAVAAYMERRSGVRCTADNVVVTAGAVAAVASALLTLADPGDEVLVPDPSWPNYTQWLLLQHSVPVPYPLRQERSFVPDVADLAARTTARTKVLILNSPGNPTGALFPREAMRELLAFARQRDLWVLSDEIYERIVFDGVHAFAAAEDTDGRVVTVSGVSKTFAMTGWRLGYAIAAPAVVQVMARLQEPMTSCVNGMTQKAAEAALTDPAAEADVAAMVSAYRRRRDAAVDIVRRAGRYRYTPRGAFYILVDVRDTGMRSRDLALALLEAEGVAVAPGSAFGAGGEGFVRVSLATEDAALAEGLQRLCRFCGRIAAQTA